MRAGSEDAWVPRLILINRAPASGKSALARRYVDDHHGTAIVQVDTLRMTLPNWEQDETTRLPERDLARAAVVEHLGAGHDVVIAQCCGRLGYIRSAGSRGSEHGATFVEVVPATRNELCAILGTAGLSSPRDHALVSLLALNGLRVSEAIGADISALGLERGHRTLTVVRKGGKVATMPLAAARRSCARLCDR